VHVNHPARIAEMTNRAMTIAINERGPVQINIPRDYFYVDIEAEIPPVQYIERGAGGAQSLDEAARLLASAKYPVIMAGGGVVMSGGVEEARALAEYLSAPVVTSYLHNDAFPASHELAAGPLGYQGSKAAMRLIGKADVVLALGSRLGPFGTLPQHGMDYWPRDAQIIQVDANPRVIGLVKKIAVGVCGDARQAAAELLARLKAKKGAAKRNEARIGEIRQAKEEWAKELASWPSPSESGRIGPRQALAGLERALPRNAMVSTDIGNVCSVANSYLRFDQPQSFFAAMSFGNCGYAFPTIMGAKVARPDRPAIAYVGDGAWGMSLAEVMTCVREEIPAIAVVFNNMQWGAEKKNQIDYYGNRFVGTNLTNPNFAEVAKAMGADGVRVDHVDQIGDALAAAVRSDRCTVLDVQLTRELGEPFRRDALKKPVRYLEKYKAYT
jgi:sulfoacetaldehyde acetyltransferase